ncbi:hypothetical protein KC992_03280 [Candidatus Saccharibacteria bacterium]|nr:hypothetical protein [Candidatus Saccharibacteria bacterium]
MLFADLGQNGCSLNEVIKWNGSSWACASDVDTDTVLNEAQVDAYTSNNGYLTSEVDGSTSNELQDLTFASNVIGLTSSGVSFDLSAYLDNTDTLASLSCSNGQVAQWNGSTWICASAGVDTDDQTLTLIANTLSIADGNSVDLSGYLDNTDSQTLSYATGTQLLTIGGGNSVSLNSLLDNTDAQSISRTGDTLSITGNASTVDLTPYLDNTDTLASLSCSNGQVAQWNGSVWVCASAAVDTDDQTLTYTTGTQTLTIDSGNSVSLSSLLDNTDNQTISLLGNILTLGNGTGSDTTVDISAYLDNTDSQDLSLVGNSLVLTGDGTNVDLSGYLDNTDTLASLSCSSNNIAKWNGSAWVCANDEVNDADASATNELQDLSFAADILSLSGSASTIDLSGYLDNTDAQALSLLGNTLSLVAGGSVDLTPYLDNTDAQDLNLIGNTLSLTGDGTTVDLSAYLDDTVLNEAQVDAYVANNGYLTSEVDGSTSNELQDLTFAGNVLGLTSSGVSFDLSAYLDNTDAQDLSLSGNNLVLTGDGTNVDLSSFLDNTDSQSISVASNILSISGNVSTVDLSGYLDNTDTQDLSLVGNSLSLVDGGSVDLTPYLDNTDALAGLSCGLNQIPKWNGSAWVCSVDVDTDAQDLSLSGNLLVLTNDGTNVDLSSFLDNTDSQAISLAGNTLSITGDAGTVDLSAYLDDTVLNEAQVDAYVANNGYLTSEVDGSTVNELQDLNLTANVLTITGLGSPTSIDLSPYLDNTDTQDLSLIGNTLSLVAGGSVDLSGYLDNTDVLASLSCGLNQIAKWNGSAWVCSADVDTDTTYSAGTGLDLSGTVFSLADSGVLAGSYNNVSVDSKGRVLSGSNVAYITSESDGVIGNEVLNATTSQGLVRSGTGTVGDPYTLGLMTCLDTQILKYDNGSTSWVCASDNGTSYSAGTGINIAGTVISTTLGTDIDSSEIVDGTITGTDIQDGTVSNADLANSQVTVTAGTGLSGGGTISLGGTVALSSSLGTDISSSEIVDGTILFADFEQNGCNSGEVIEWNGSAWVCGTDDFTDGDASATNELQDLFSTISSPAGTDVIADGNTDTLTLANGSGITITGDGSTDTITIASVLGASIESSEITDGTISFADIAQNGCNSSDIIQWNGSAWACGTDSDTTYSAGTGISFAGTVISADLGSSIDSSEIIDGTITFADINQNSCLGTQIMKWNGSIWTCANDEVDDADASSTNELQNLFGTFSTSSGTSPVADSTSDTLSLVAGSNVTITGDSSTDTITIAASFTESDGVIGNEVLDATAGGGLERAGSGTGGSPFTLGLRTDCGTGQGLEWSGVACGCADDDVNDADASATNELQDIFTIISTPAGSNPQVDSNADTLTFTNGSGISITGDGLTDSIAIAATLGTDIDSSEIVNGTILLADLNQNGCTGGQIFKWNGSAWTCANDEVDDADASATNELQNLFETIATPNGTSPVSDSTTDTLSFADGSGITITGDGSTDTITIASVLGASIDSSEITDGTITFADIAQNSCNSGEVIEWAGSAWSCGTDNDTTYSAGTGISFAGTVISSTLGTDIDSSEIVNNTITAVDVANNTFVEVARSSAQTDTSTNSTVFINKTGASGNLVQLQVSGGDEFVVGFDGTIDSSSVDATSVVDGSLTGTDIQDGSITGTDVQDGSIANGDLTNSSVTVTASTGLSGGGSVSLGGTVVLSSTLGTDIDSSEIVNGTITAADVAGNVFIELGRASSQTDSSTNSTIFVNKTGGSGNLIQLQAGAADEFVVGFDGTIDSSSVDGVSVIDGSLTGADIQDGSVANGDLTNSAVTVVSGNGLANGGSVSLGGSVTLDIGAGTGITVNANDIQITDDGLNFTQFADALSLDAATTISLGANNLTTNLNSTGDYAIQFGGNTIFQILDTGVVTIGSILSDQTIGVDNGTGAINIATDSDANTTNIGTGTGADTVTIGDSNANVSLTDAQWSISGAGDASFTSLTNSGSTLLSAMTISNLATGGAIGTAASTVDIATTFNVNQTTANQTISLPSPTTTTAGRIAYVNSVGTVGFTISGQRLEAGQSRQYIWNGSAWTVVGDQRGEDTVAVLKTANELVNNTKTPQDDDELFFSIGANETWIVEFSVTYQSPTAQDMRFQVDGPAGATCVFSILDSDEGAGGQDNTPCNTNMTTITDSATDESARIFGVITTAGTAGTVQLQWAQNVAAAVNTTVFDGSYLNAVKIRGADLAEFYFSEDYTIAPGDIVSLAGNGVSQVQKTNGAYDTNALGVISTRPGQVLGEADGFGRPVIVGLKGRVPAKVSEENGEIKAGDYITASSEPGIGMKATRSGRVIGRALTDYDGNGTVMVFIENGYWQAPISINLSSIFGEQAAANLSQTADDLALSQVLGTQFNSLDQAAVDEILRGFTIQQGKIDDIASRLGTLENDQGIALNNILNQFVLDDGTVTFISDVVFNGSVQFGSEVIFSNNSAGSVTIPAGQTSVEISFAPPLSKAPTIIVSPNSFMNGTYRQTNSGLNGFRIELEKVQDNDVIFSWQALLTQGNQ